MPDTNYTGLDIHKEAISIAVMIAAGKSVAERIIETKASTILQFIQSVRGDLHVTSDDPSLVSLRRPYLYQRCRRRWENYWRRYCRSVPEERTAW